MNVPPTIPFGGTGAANEGLANISRLCEVPLSPDPSPSIHINPVAVEYATDFDARFHDRTSFVAALSKYLEEAADQAKMVMLLNSSVYFLGFLKLMVNLS